MCIQDARSEGRIALCSVQLGQPAVGIVAGWHFKAQECRQEFCLGDQGKDSDRDVVLEDGDVNAHGNITGIIVADFPVCNTLVFLFRGCDPGTVQHSQNGGPQRLCIGQTHPDRRKGTHTVNDLMSAQIKSHAFETGTIQLAVEL